MTITYHYSFVCPCVHAVSIICSHFINKVFYSVSEYCMYSRSIKKRNTPIYFNTNYRRKMKLVLIIMDYCLLEFDALKFFLRVRLHGGSQPNFNFFNVTPPPQIFQRNRKVPLPNCLETNFHDISIISLRVIRHRNYS